MPRIYESARWRRLRRLKLRKEPMCALCPPGFKKPATDVDHVLPVRDRPDLAWDWGNLQSLCHECHSVKTGSERSENVLMPGCDRDGLPLDARHWWRQ
jgi:5-methylcytosine-specific restriction endonuclease McrA